MMDRILNHARQCRKNWPRRARRAMDGLMAYIRQLYRRDVGWMVLSFLLALAIYYHVDKLINERKTFRAAFRVVTERGLTGTVEDLSRVDVEIRGTKASLDSLSDGKLAFVLKPKGAAGDRVRMRLEERMLEGKGRLRVTSIMPPEVNVLITHERRVELPVMPPMIVGKPLHGQAKLQYDTQHAEVFGDGAYLDKMVADGVTLQTETIDVEGRSKSFAATVKIDMPITTAVREIRPSEITVQVNIIHDLVTKNFDNVPLQLSAPPEMLTAWSAGTNAVRVRITGLPAVMQDLTISNITAVADIKPVIDGLTNQVPVRVSVPNDITVESVESMPAVIPITKVEPLVQ